MANPQDSTPSADPICCFDCGRPYDDGGFQDLILPNDIWRQISPTNDEGGLLCPSCICKKAHDLGITCTAIFRSGPFRDRERADPNKRADTADATPDTTPLRTALERAREFIRPTSFNIKAQFEVDAIDAALSTTSPAVPDTTAIVEAARNVLRPSTLGEKINREAKLLEVLIAYDQAQERELKGE